MTSARRCGCLYCFPARLIVCNVGRFLSNGKSEAYVSMFEATQSKAEAPARPRGVETAVCPGEAEAAGQREAGGARSLDARGRPGAGRLVPS